MVDWSGVWQSQIELNDLFIEELKNLSGRTGVNHIMIIVIIIWLLILTYKLFKKQQKP